MKRTLKLNLESYKFHRTKFSYIEHVWENHPQFTQENIQYLVANAENGGLALLSGTGFKMFFADGNWKDKNGRWASEGFRVMCSKYHQNPEIFHADNQPTLYQQTLRLDDGIVHTEVGFGVSKGGYKTTLFMSQSNKSLMVLTISNTDDISQEWQFILPEETYDVECGKKQDTQTIAGVRNGEEYYTKTAWAFWSSKPFKDRKIVLAPNESVQFRFTFTSNWNEGEKYAEVAKSALEIEKTHAQILSDNNNVWKEYWENAAIVFTPDEEINKLYYRCIYWNFCQNGSRYNLAPEAAFAGLDFDYYGMWAGHPFCYGSSVFSISSFLMLGRSELAKNALECLYRPEALSRNAKRYTDIDGALSFAHENDRNGYEIAGGIWGTQRHIDGFVAAMFSMYHQYHPEDEEFFRNRVYPVFKGVAQFYRGTLSYSEEHHSYIFPNWLSVSEGFEAKPHTLDVVLNGVYVLHQAAEYARALGEDLEDASEWERIANNIYIPQNDRVYEQHLVDSGRVEAGEGYFGKRAQVYLGIPYLLSHDILDKEKAKRTMSTCWIENNYGENMISFIAAWNAKTSAWLGLGDLALEMLRHYFKCNANFVCEAPGGMPYFQSTTGFIQAFLSMFVQGDDGVIRVGLAIPSVWEKVQFANITTIGGVSVSGEYDNGVLSVTCRNKNGQVLFTQEKGGACLFKL